MDSEECRASKAGDKISIGGYSWQVLDVQSGRALVLCDIVIELRQYNRNFIDVTWETSTLRQFLNSDFYNRFSAEEKNYITETKIHNNKNPWFDTKAGAETNDRVFLLSLGEVVKYFGDSGWLASRPDEARRIDDEYNSARIARDADGTDSWGSLSPCRS